MWRDMAATYPLFALQYAAIAGILSVTLLAFRLRNRPAEQALIYGVVLGIVGYLLTAFTQQFLQGVPVKPLARAELLFFAGMLGGWRGGMVALAMMVAARLQFAEASWTIALGTSAEQGITLLAGLGLYGWYQSANKAHIRFREVLLVWAVFVAAQLLGALCFTYIAGQADSVRYTQLLRKLGGAPRAWVNMLALFTLFRMDAKDRRMQAQQLAQKALDVMTGLRNRLAMREHLEKCYTATPHECITLLCIDLSNLPELLLDRKEGWREHYLQELDRVLREGPMQALLQPYQPEAFLFHDMSLALVLRGTVPADMENQGVASRLHQQLSLHWSQNHGADPAVRPAFQLTVADGSRALFDNAPAALHDLSLHLRTQGMEMQSGVRYFSRTIAQEAELNVQIESMLFQWLEGKQPPLYYQPKCSLASGETVGAEALLRCVDAQGEPVSPARVLAVVNKTQLFAAFEWATIEQAANDALSLRARGHTFSLSVNISGASLMTEGFATRVCVLLRALTLPTSALVLELTEYSKLPDLEAVRENAQQLHEAGIKLSLDDFGTGYSGLSVLGRLAFAEVKIDQGMVALIEQPRMHAAIQLAIETASRYGAHFVAEGVETAEQSGMLEAMGVTTAQGFLFAKAMTLAQLATFADMPLPTKGRPTQGG